MIAQSEALPLTTQEAFLNLVENQGNKEITTKLNVIAVIGNMLKWHMQAMPVYDKVIAFFSYNKAVLFSQDVLNVLAENNNFMMNSFKHHTSRAPTVIVNVRSVLLQL